MMHALEPVYRRYAGPLLRYAYRFVRDQAAAEELVHDVFVQFLNGKCEAACDAELKAWLFVAIKNKCLDQLKKAGREVRSDAAIERAVAAEAPSDDREARLRLATERLPADLRSTWELRRDGCDNREIARRLGIPIGTVKSRFFRLVEKLKEDMDA